MGPTYRDRGLALGTSKPGSRYSMPGHDSHDPSQVSEYTNPDVELRSHNLMSGTSDVMQAFYDEMTTTIGPNQTLFGRSVPTVSPPMALLDRLCDAVSSHIRAVADPSNAVPTSSYVQQSVVEARWVWAIYPGALALFAFCFTGAVIVTSVSSGMPIWKSSSLATLLHGLDENSCEAIAAGRLVEMEDNAKVWTMQMEMDGQHQRLRGEGPSSD
jgi:hypothetical protein